MAEPKKLLETALFSLLDGALTPAVYNTEARGSSFNYVVFQAVGGDDEDYHRKTRGRLYEYQVVGVNTDRATALDMFVAIDAAMAGATSLSVSGQGIVDVHRREVVDYTEVTPDGIYIHHVGGIWAIELEEV